MSAVADEAAAEGRTVKAVAGAAVVAIGGNVVGETWSGETVE